MKSYKEYEKVFIGDSDIAALTFVGITKNGLEAKILDFGCDGRYNAYIVDENATIGDHYTLEMEYETSSGFKAWLKIYDDEGLTADYRADQIIVLEILVALFSLSERKNVNKEGGKYA